MRIALQRAWLASGGEACKRRRPISSSALAMQLLSAARTPLSRRPHAHRPGVIRMSGLARKIERAGDWRREDVHGPISPERYDGVGPLDERLARPSHTPKAVEGSRQGTRASTGVNGAIERKRGSPDGGILRGDRGPRRARPPAQPPASGFPGACGSPPTGTRPPQRRRRPRFSQNRRNAERPWSRGPCAWKPRHAACRQSLARASGFRPSRRAL